ncbi:hypothetical protein Mapa_000537 [Marchantia paleacea]|nr:hypothetical protein Mapa_000537 [Marchantia paleacea]
MQFPGFRFMKFHRMVLVPPLCLLTFLCLWTSSTLSPLNISHQSFSQDVQCTSCTDDSPFPATSAFLSLANFPTTSYIKDVVLRNNFLKVEDSTTEPISRMDSNEVVSVEGNSGEHDVVLKARSTGTATVSDNPGDSECFRASSECFKIEPEPASQSPPLYDGGDLDLSDFRDDDLRALADEEGSKSEMRNDNPDNRHLQSEQDERHGNASSPSSYRRIVAEPEERSEQEVVFKHDNMTAEDTLAASEVEKLMRYLRESALPPPNTSSDQPFIYPAKDKTLYVRDGTPQGTVAPEQPSCDGRYIYIYDLPRKFNADLVGQCDTLLPWFNFCDYFLNEGMGLVVPTEERNSHNELVLVPDGGWHLTHQYSLELIFHARLKNYPCLTTDENKASLFYIPYYGGLDVIRWHFTDNVTNDHRDALTWELVHWLETKETWKRNGGIDHVLVLGKISWDFRRPSDNDHWGSKLLQLPAMVPPTKLLIERNPWHPNDIGVPHPTFFHPKSDDEIRTWQSHCEKSERRYLVSFAGMPRPNMLGNVRGHLIQQCLDSPQDCFLLRCEKTLCLRPDSTMDLFLHSHFCMQPPGDSPTRRSVFDSLIGGCIPVLFDPYTAYYQYPWHLPEDPKSFSVYIPSRHVMKGKANIIEILKGISPEERAAMHTRIIQDIIPGLLYSKPGSKHPSYRDAFDISIEGLLQRVANLRAEAAFAAGQ